MRSFFLTIALVFPIQSFANGGVFLAETTRGSLASSSGGKIKGGKLVPDRKIECQKEDLNIVLRSGGAQVTVEYQLINRGKRTKKIQYGFPFVTVEMKFKNTIEIMNSSNGNNALPTLFISFLT